MTIISALPYTLTNGTVADATQVMANFNQILNNVNANAQMGGATVNLGQTTANVNYVQVSGNTTGNAPIIAFTGTDSAVGGTISVKGASNLSLSTGGGVQVKINDTPSAVNFLNFTGGATGNAPSISATGSDTNVGLLLQAQGASGITCAVNSVTQFSIGNTGSAVNYLQVSGGAAGISPSLAALGSDTNLGMVIQCKGLGLTKFQNAAGVESFAIGQIASAVNYVQVNPAGTGTAPSIYAFGSDTNVGLNLTAQGTGTVNVGGGGGISTTTLSISVGRGLVLTNQANQASTGSGTLTNAPLSGNPNLWLPIKANGINYSIPCW